jgi:hypothetical protein
MAEENTKKRSLPLLVVKTGTVSKEDIKRAEESAFICIIESENPEALRILDMPLQTASLDAQSRAALSLLRRILSAGNSTANLQKADLVQIYVEALIGKEEVVPKVPSAKQVKS